MQTKKSKHNHRTYKRYNIAETNRYISIVKSQWIHVYQTDVTQTINTGRRSAQKQRSQDRSSLERITIAITIRRKCKFKIAITITKNIELQLQLQTEIQHQQPKEVVNLDQRCTNLFLLLSKEFPIKTKLVFNSNHNMTPWISRTTTTVNKKYSKYLAKYVMMVLKAVTRNNLQKAQAVMENVLVNAVVINKPSHNDRLNKSIIHSILKFLQMETKGCNKHYVTQVQDSIFQACSSTNSSLQQDVAKAIGVSVCVLNQARQRNTAIEHSIFCLSIAPTKRFSPILILQKISWNFVIQTRALWSTRIQGRQFWWRLVDLLSSQMLRCIL